MTRCAYFTTSNFDPHVAKMFNLTSRSSQTAFPSSEHRFLRTSEPVQPRLSHVYTRFVHRATAAHRRTSAGEAPAPSSALPSDQILISGEVFRRVPRLEETEHPSFRKESSVGKLDTINL